MFTFRTIAFVWAWNRRSLDRVKPQCLCASVFAIGCPQNHKVTKVTKGQCVQILYEYHMAYPFWVVSGVQHNGNVYFDICPQGQVIKSY